MGKKAKKAKKQYRAALARVGSSLLTQAERFKYSDSQPRDGSGKWTSGADVRTGYAPARGDILHEHTGPRVHGHPGFQEAAMPGRHAHQPTQGVAVRGHVDPATGQSHVDPTHSGTIHDARPAIEQYGSPEHEFWLREREMEEG